MVEAKAQGRRFYRGWLVLLGAFLAHLAAIGATHASFGLFVVPASEELGLSRADANTWLIVMGIGSATLAPFAGKLLDRVSVRLVMGLGGLIMAASHYVMSTTSSIWLLLAIALVPLAFASDCAGGLAANTVTVRWFRRHRGRALAVVSMSVAAGGVVVPPVVGFLIGDFGWRSALALLGAGCGLLILLSAILLVRVRPSEEELRAAGEDLAGSQASEARVWGYKDLLRNRNFLLIAFGGGLFIASDRALLVSVAPYFSDGGFTVQQAGVMLSVLGGSSLAGKLLVGYLADFVDPRRIFIAVAALHIALLGVLMVEPSYPVLIGAAAVLGIGLGGVMPAQQVLTASVFGSASYGTVLGTAAIIIQVLMMVALRFIGEVHDRTGSYGLAFQVFIAVVVISTMMIWRIRRPTDEVAA